MKIVSVKQVNWMLKQSKGNAMHGMLHTTVLLMQHYSKDSKVHVCRHLSIETEIRIAANALRLNE